MLNSVELEGELEKKEALRYSLAGIPILEFTIRYKGIAQEGGAERVLNFSAAAMAVGETAKKVSDLELGSEKIFKGFVSTASARSSKLTLHITEYI